MRILLIGAGSAIGEHVARRLASEKTIFCLTGRNSARLNTIAADLKLRGATQVETRQFDIIGLHHLEGFISRSAQSLGGIDALVIAAGHLPDQAEVNFDSHRLRETMQINAMGIMLILNEAAAFFEQQGHGQIVAIGSVAGDRGRATNYAYGAAKGALEIFLSGLRQRLHKSGIKVLLVKPGFVDTPMTAAFKKGPLWASPERVAKDIVRAMDKGKSVIYTPWWWRWIMLVIRLIPEPIFARLRF